MRHFFLFKIMFLFVLSLAIATGCGQKELKKAHTHSASIVATSLQQGLAFVGVDLYYQSADAFYYNFSSGLIEPIAYGQSGDSFVAFIEPTLYLFNRTPLRHNFLSLSFEEGRWRSDQAVSQDFERGDPHAVISLKNGHLLLTYFGKGKVVEIEPKTGRLIKEFIFSLAPGSQFHPSSMFKVRIGSEDVIFIAHKGITIDQKDLVTFGNSSQAIYALIDRQDGPIIVAGGRPVAYPLASNPVFVNTDLLQPLVVGLCYEGSKNCQQAIEVFDPIAAMLGNPQAAFSSSYSLDSQPFRMNGMIASGFEEGSVFANVVSKDFSVNTKFSWQKQVIKMHLDPERNLFSWEKIYTYSWDKSSGAYLLLGDATSKTLFIGDVKNESSAYLIVKGPERQEEVALPRIPYHGALVSR